MDEGSLLLRTIVQYLISAGADVNKRTKKYKNSALHYAAMKNDLGCARLLVEAGARVTNGEQSDLLAAGTAGAFDKNLQLVKLLVENGAKVNDRGWNNETPMHVAAFWGRADVVSFLISRGGDVNADDDDYTSDSRGTPVQAAIMGFQWGKADSSSLAAVLDAFVVSGTDLDAESGWYAGPPLVYAQRNRVLEGVIALLDRGADPNLLHEGKTYLHRVADFTDGGSREVRAHNMAMDAKIADLLIAAGANVHLEEYPGELLEIASKCDNKPVAIVLKDAGAEGRYTGKAMTDWAFRGRGVMFSDIGRGVNQIEIGMTRERVAEIMHYAEPDIMGHGVTRTETIVPKGQDRIPTRMNQTEEWTYVVSDPTWVLKILFVDGVVVDVKDSHNN